MCYCCLEAGMCSAWTWWRDTEWMNEWRRDFRRHCKLDSSCAAPELRTTLVPNFIEPNVGCGLHQATSPPIMRMQNSDNCPFLSFCPRNAFQRHKEEKKWALPLVGCRSSPPGEGPGEWQIVISKWHMLANSQVLNLKFFFSLSWARSARFESILWQILDFRTKQHHHHHHHVGLIVVVRRNHTWKVKKRYYNLLLKQKQWIKDIIKCCH